MLDKQFFLIFWLVGLGVNFSVGQLRPSQLGISAYLPPPRLGPNVANFGAWLHSHPQNLNFKNQPNFLVDPAKILGKIYNRDKELKIMMEKDQLKYIASREYDQLRMDNILAAYRQKHQTVDPIEDFINNQILKDQISHFGKHRKMRQIFRGQSIPVNNVGEVMAKSKEEEAKKLAMEKMRAEMRPVKQEKSHFIRDNIVKLAGEKFDKGKWLKDWLSN